MEVKEAKDLLWSLFLKICHNLFDCIDFWSKPLVWIQIVSVQILAYEGRTIVPYDHTIRVNHRYYFENKFISQPVSNYTRA